MNGSGYHHLFQQLLQHQLEQHRSAEEIARLHLRACEWFAGQGLLDEAIRHALAGEDVERAVLLVEEHRQTILNADREYLLEKWLALLPDNVKMERPALLLAQAWVYRYQFKLPAILPLLDRVESLFERETADEPLQGEVDFFRGYCGVFLGDSARSLDYLTRAIERVPFHYHMLRGEAEIMLGLAAQMKGRLAEAMQTMEDILAHQHALTSIRKTRVLAALVFLKIIAAEFDDAALMYLQRLYDVAVEGHHDYAKAWSFCLQGLIASARYEPEAAIQHFRRAVELRYVLHARAAIDSLAGLSFAYQLTQQTEQADATLALLFEFVRPFSEPAFLALAQSCQARLAVMQGKLDTALRWLKSSPAPAAEVMFWWLEIPALTSCRVLLAEGSEASLREAEQRLQETVRMTQEHHNVYRQIDSLALLALVYAGQGHPDDALTSLEDALVLAEPGGVIGPFIEPGPLMADLLTQLCRRSARTDFIEQILSAFNAETTPAPEPFLSSDEDESIERFGRQAALPEPPANRASSAGDQAWIVESLTDREIEVLELLNQRLYNKEIAEEMAIALETVKSHLKNIYQKLNVKGRRQAVAKAHKLGLLPR